MITQEMKVELTRALEISSKDSTNFSNEQTKFLPSFAQDIPLSTKLLGPLRKRKFDFVTDDCFSNPASCDENETVDVISDSPQDWVVTNCDAFSDPVDVVDKNTWFTTFQDSKKTKACSHPLQTCKIRLEQNRIAARKSRLRKKELIYNLRSTVMNFGDQNRKLLQEKHELEQVLLKAKEFIEKGQKSHTSNDKISNKQTVPDDSPEQVVSCTYDSQVSSEIKTLLKNTPSEETFSKQEAKNSPHIEKEDNIHQLSAKPSTINLGSLSSISDIEDKRNVTIPSQAFPVASCAANIHAAVASFQASLLATASISPEKSPLNISNGSFVSCNPRVSFSLFTLPLLSGRLEHYYHLNENAKQHSSKTEATGTTNGKEIQSYDR